MKPPTPSRSAGLDLRQFSESTPTEPLLVGAPRAAEMLAISTRTLWSMSVSGEIPSLKIRSRRLYDVRDLLDWIDAQKRKAVRRG